MYSTTNQAEEDEILDSCLICFENFSLNHKIACLPCGHIFGNQCLQDWLNNESRCPTCNGYSTKNDIRLIFGKTILITESEQLAKKELVIANQNLALHQEQIDELKFQIVLKESENMQLKKDLEEERTMRTVFEQQLNETKSTIDKNKYDKVMKELEEERTMRIVFEIQIEELKSILDDDELNQTKKELNQFQEASKIFEQKINQLKLDLIAKDLENVQLKKKNEETCEELVKKATVMLNKLESENYEIIAQQFKDPRVININSLEKLKKIVKLIYEKAIDEPAFCVQYAMLCCDMSTVSVTLELLDSDPKPIKFNALLIERCQKCFEANEYKNIDIVGRQKEIDNCTDEEKRRQLIGKLDEEKRLIMKRSLGNIKLIGALYQVDRLKAEIMDLCIDTLFKNDDEHSYERICLLLKSIGEKFETSFIDKSKFNAQMKQLEQVIETDKISSRIKSMIMNVLEMRKDSWRPRESRDVNTLEIIEIENEVKTLK